MLTRLTIDNYVLIDTLAIDFSKGLTIITGETGAGKSILLGALSLILGQRAESGVVKDALRNCVVEASFDVKGHPEIIKLLIQNELEVETEIIVRRVITIAGKSRAFINDSPVGLPLLRQLGSQIIDIHAQHENLLLRQSDFQLQLIDGYAGLDEMREAYQEALAHYRSSLLLRNQQKAILEKGTSEQEYLRFQWEQLTAARLIAGEQQELEEELATLSHAQEIREALSGALHLLQEQEVAAMPLLREATTLIQKVVRLYPSLEDSSARLEVLRIELKDICSEIVVKEERVQDNPTRLEEITQRLDTLYNLMRKHKCASVAELIGYRDSLALGFKGTEELEAILAQQEKEVRQALQRLDVCAVNLSEARKKALPGMEQKAVERLRYLGIPHAILLLKLNEEKDYGTLGKESPEFLFSANREVAPGALAQIASGGELSRIMLCMKSLMVQSTGLPTIIFDEIDLGVSGRIADKMGEILQEMSKNMQVVAITHLPQIASKGATHLTVYKEQYERGSRTCLRQLSSQERIMEIARLLSGSEVTEAAVSNAKQLLNIS
ncbi:MAG: DNA repair protein RecN [Bacteroidales bacterium]|nr:DNA repair protein RecN [Bacteroidales bacterium]